MNRAQLADKLEKLASEATPGKWSVFTCEGDYGGGVIVSTHYGDGARALDGVISQPGGEPSSETVGWNEDCPPYTRPEGNFANILGDSDLGVGVGDEQTAKNFALIVALHDSLGDIISILREKETIKPRG